MAQLTDPSVAAAAKQPTNDSANVAVIHMESLGFVAWVICAANRAFSSLFGKKPIIGSRFGADSPTKIIVSLATTVVLSPSAAAFAMCRRIIAAAFSYGFNAARFATRLKAIVVGSVFSEFIDGLYSLAFWATLEPIGREFFARVRDVKFSLLGDRAWLTVGRKFVAMFVIDVELARVLGLQTAGAGFVRHVAVLLGRVDSACRTISELSTYKIGKELKLNHAFGVGG